MKVLELADAELATLVRTPAALDALGDPGDVVVVVTNADGTVVEADALASLPCVVVGLGHEPAAPPAHVDIAIEPAIASLEQVLAVIAANPIAATTLALLLRDAASRTIGAGLVAESAAYSLLQAGPEFGHWRESRPRKARPPEVGPAVLVARQDDQLMLTLNRPHVRNALDRSMRDGLLEGFTLAIVDPTIAAITVQGAGRTFCSGGDLDEFGTFEDPASAHLVRLTGSIGRLIADVADRTTFAVHGACAGSGVELPAFAGTVIADPATTFALPEVSLGLVPGAGGTVSLTRRVGRHRVAVLALSGSAIDAATALAWGLIDGIDVVEG